MNFESVAAFNPIVACVANAVVNSSVTGFEWPNEHARVIKALQGLVKNPLNKPYLTASHHF